MKNTIFISALLFAFVLLSGCSKMKEKLDQKSDEKVNKETEKVTEDANREMQKKDSIKLAETQQNEKDTKIKTALDEQKILDDERGQWAVDADASSTYSPDKENIKSNWHQHQMTGKPDVEHYGDDARAWASSEADKGIEWVTLTFAKAVNADELKIRQSYNPGAIIKIDLIDENGKNHTVWEGSDKTKYTMDEIQWFDAKFEKTTYKTKKIKITLACNAIPGWNEIDAVQLLGD